jgi:hypothetical protein
MNPLTAAAALLEVVLLGPWIWARQRRGVRLGNALLVPSFLTGTAILGTVISSTPRLPAVAAFTVYCGLVLWRVVAIRPHEIDRRIWRAARRLGLTRPPLIIPGAITLALMLSSVVSVGLLAQSIPVLVITLVMVGICLGVVAVPKRHWLALIAGPFALTLTGIALGALDGSWQWVDSSNSASQATAQLVASQLALGVVPIAVATVGGQVAISWIGPRATKAVPVGWVIGSIGAVLLSVGIDIFLIGHGTSSVVWTELAELTACVTVAFAGLAVLAIVRSLEPENVAQRFARRLDRAWLLSLQVPGRAVGERPIYLDDPFHAIERVLSAAVGKDTEQQLFRVALAVLTDRIKQIGFTRTLDNHGRETFAGPLVEVEASLDAYLADELEALVYLAAQQRRHWAIDELIGFRQNLQPVVYKWVETGPDTAFGTRSEAAFPLRGGPFRVPDGCQTYALLFRASLEGGLDENAWLAAIRLSAFFRRGLQELPTPEGVFRVDPGAQYPGTPSAGAEVRDAIEGFGFVYRRLVESAVHAKNLRALEGLAVVPEEIVDAALGTADERWASWLADQGLRLGLEAAMGAEELGSFVMPLRTFLITLQAGNTAHARIAESLGLWVPPIIRAGQSKLTIPAVMEFTMIALHLLPAYPIEAARVTDAMVTVKDRMIQTNAPGTRSVATEVDARLKQLRQNAGASLNQFNRTLRNLRKARHIS